MYLRQADPAAPSPPKAKGHQPDETQEKEAQRADLHTPRPGKLVHESRDVKDDVRVVFLVTRERLVYRVQAASGPGLGEGVGLIVVPADRPGIGHVDDVGGADIIALAVDGDGDDVSLVMAASQGYGRFETVLAEIGEDVLLGLDAVDIV
jgi:hypothetical protein